MVLSSLVRTRDRVSLDAPSNGSAPIAYADIKIVASTIQQALEENAHPTQPQPGPLKQMIGTIKTLDA
jgi:hypothetical protein